MVTPQAASSPGWRSRALGAIAGGAVGFGVAWVVYSALNPVLETSAGLARELQGLLWNVVPVLTVVGAVAGFLVVAARHGRKR